LYITLLLLASAFNGARFALRFCSGCLGSLLSHHKPLVLHDQLALSFNILSAHVQLAFKILHASPGGVILFIQMSDFLLKVVHG
jgi:hypothetical protein